MATYGFYEIYDTEADYWRLPFPAHNNEEACRLCLLAMQQDQALGQFPEQFQLWRCGWWTEEDGNVVVPDGGKLFIESLARLKKARDAQEHMAAIRSAFTEAAEAQHGEGEGGVSERTDTPPTGLGIA